METGPSCLLSPRLCLAGVCGGGQTEAHSGLSVSVAQVLAQPGSAPEQQASVPVSLIRGAAQARSGPGDAAPTAGARALPLPPGFWFYLCCPSATPGQPPSWSPQLPPQSQELGCPAEAAARGGARGCPMGGPHAPSPHQDPLVLDRRASPGTGLPAGELLRGTGMKPMFRLEPPTGTTSARLEGGERR